MVESIEAGDRYPNFDSNLSSAASSTSSSYVRTKNTFIEVMDDDECKYLETMRSSRSHSLPELYSKTQPPDLATILLQQMNGLQAELGTKDITTATCATVENFLPRDPSCWSEGLVMDLLRNRGFDTGLIRCVKFLTNDNFGKVKIKFVDHPSVLAFKLLFDQSSFDGTHTCQVKIVDCCCSSKMAPMSAVRAPEIFTASAAEPPSLDQLLPVPSEQPVSMAQQKPPAKAKPDPNSKDRLFVGGLAPETTDAALHEHFRKYGELSEAAVILDKRSKLSRGFGFVAFVDGKVPQILLDETHVIDGKEVGVRLYGSSPARNG